MRLRKGEKVEDFGKEYDELNNSLMALRAQKCREWGKKKKRYAERCAEVEWGVIIIGGDEDV